MEDIVNTLRKSFNTDTTKSYEWRKTQLLAIEKLLDENKEQFVEALKLDLNKPNYETIVYEIGTVKSSINFCLNHLKTYIEPQKVKPIIQARAVYSTYVQYQPFGVCLIIGAWNYPIYLTLTPLIGAISSGNCAILKPSEMAPKIAELLENLFPKYLDTNFIRVVNGGVTETTQLLEQKFDHIFYTGNGTVGRIVMQAAAKHMTPVVLECGGKSPVYIDETADLLVTARRILWAKFTNSGQTCVAPDYVLCTKETQENIIPFLKQILQEFYGGSPKDSNSFARIINERHFDRIIKLIDETKVVVGGISDRNEKYIAPTIMFNVTVDDKVMNEEIFGPVLPFITITDRNEAIKFINSRDKPLALYVFSNKEEVYNDFKNRTSSGSFCYNDLMVQLALECLPFGGVGESGLGRYHGIYSFETFSHQRAILKGGFFADSLSSFRYPPYSDSNISRGLLATSEFKSCSIL
ncbi:unnamed protein product [Brachionus calyciflorus]|uniref:Aldehyde dehydrogenase n=1 Tax=Brachionus calyciflorus TaxID=104777 RepID=A0A813M9H4_9BILA|nr:unnamed protein product [Brachionus calyciflorus]